MNRSIKIILVILLFVSCKKDTELKYEDKNPGKYGLTQHDYYFKGTIKDTTNNNSLIDYRLFYSSCGTDYNDTITDSTYFYHYRVYTGKSPCTPISQIRINDRNDNLVHFHYINKSLHKENDTIQIDIFF